MRKECAVCSEPFEAKRNTAKYCSKRCNVRAARQPKRKAAAPEDDVTPRRWLAEAGELARQVGWMEGVARAEEALRQIG